MKTQTYLDEQAKKFLLLDANQSQLDQDTRNRLAMNELRLEDTVFFAAVRITGMGGTAELVTASSTIKRGTINFDKSELPKLQNLIVKGIKVGYGFSGGATPVTDPALVKYSNRAADALQAVYRASFVIRQDDKVVFERPIADLLSEEVGRGLASDNNTYWLENFRLLTGNRRIAFTLEFPEGQSANAAGEHFFEFRLIGTKTRVK